MKKLDGRTIAKARDAWFKSEEGKNCLEGGCSGQYLRNRLKTAFLAGTRVYEVRRPLSRRTRSKR